MDEPYEDRLSIATPEGVPVELVLAGLGSRLVARLLDSLVQGVIILAFVILVSLTEGAAIMVAVFFIAIFAAWFLYDPVFELLASGRTPGKRWTGLRVVTTEGGPVGLAASAARNLLRLVDILPGMYLLGSIVIVASSKSQRIGDLVAGTLVVRERRTRPVSLDDLRPVSMASVDWSEVAAWDVSAISPAEVALVRQFLQRRHSLDQSARQRLGVDLASRLYPRIVGAPPNMPPERFLERLLVAKDARA